MNLDITKLLDEVDAEVKALLKSAQDDASLKKADEEDDKEEGSGYESQAPEASEPAPAAEAAPAEEAPAPAPEQEGSAPQEPSHDSQMQEAESIENELQNLDDDTLHEIYQKIKMELMSRMQSQAQAPQEQSQAAPEAQQPQPMQMSEKTADGEKLEKAQSEIKAKDEEIDSLKKSLEEFADIVKTLIDRPVVRAVTDVQFVPKEGELKKSEMTDEDIRKSVDSISSDRKKLATLTKHELDVISDFYSGRNVKDKILKIVNK